MFFLAPRGAALGKRVSLLAWEACGNCPATSSEKPDELRVKLAAAIEFNCNLLIFCFFGPNFHHGRVHYYTTLFHTPCLSLRRAEVILAEAWKEPGPGVAGPERHARNPPDGGQAARVSGRFRSVRGHFGGEA